MSKPATKTKLGTTAISSETKTTTILPTISLTHFKRKWITLLSATLETWVHQLLYVRGVYPREVFTFSTFLGVRCYACRHPGVVSYISKAIQVAIPSLLLGVANEISFIVTDDVIVVVPTTKHEEDITKREVDGHEMNETIQQQQTTEAVEIFVVRISDIKNDFMFSSSIVDGTTRTTATPATIDEWIYDLERSMRDIILSVHSLETKYETMWTDSVSFKISLHIPVENKTCTELNNAFAEGKWHSSNNGCITNKYSNHSDNNNNYNGNGNDNNNVSTRIGKVIRPLFQATTVAGTFHFMMQKVAKQKVPCQKKTTNIS